MIKKDKSRTNDKNSIFLLLIVIFNSYTSSIRDPVLQYPFYSVKIDD